LSVDRLEEYFYQRLMLCYDRQGRYSKAIRVYERCRDALMKDLNVPPAKNTEYIYRKIRQPAKAVHRPLPVKRKANLPTSPLSQGVEKQ
jgi:DNA-binding SARP family transcriptional activator